jgi:L-ascorbate metabolism protein UlaG (beta-lactamase superfamily)
MVDFSGDWKIDFVDFCRLGQYWRQTESSVDIAPAPMGDGVADCRDLAVLAGCWLGEYTEPAYIRWLGHASVKIWRRDTVIYVDPRNLSESPHDATLVLVTHSHSDHYSPSDIAKVSKAGTVFIAPANVVALYGSGQVILPGQTIERQGVPVTAVAAYNLTKPNHPKANNWVGYIIQLGSQRIYCAGDTDLTNEMKAVEDIDVAILPVGGTYTMNADEAAQATSFIEPQLAIPYHWGDIVGTLADAQRFAALAACDVKIMTVGEIISSESWEHSPPIAQ